MNRRMDKVQANLSAETLQRIATLANKPPTRGIDKMINLCLDELEKTRNCSENKVESESEDV